MIKKILFSFILVLSVMSANAQDTHLSMYDAAPLFLNPAMTGVFKGDWRLHAQYRTQWKAVNFKPYTTALISLDMPVKKWGFGVQLSNYRAGYGNFNVLQGSVSAAYTTAIDRRKSHNISFGVQGGINQKSVEYQLLSWDNQYSTTYDDYFDPTISSEEVFQGQSLTTPVVNAGLLYFFAKQQSRLNPFIGVSAFNLTEPQETFFDKDNRLPMRFYGHVGTRVNITEQFYLIPKALYMQQEEFQELTLAIDAGYYLKGSDMYLVGGVVYRNEDALIVSFGAKMDKFVAKVAYDVNISTLSTVSSGRGGFEVSFTYMKQKRKPKTEKICPRL